MYVGKSKKKIRAKTGDDISTLIAARVDTDGICV